MANRTFTDAEINRINKFSPSFKDKIQDRKPRKWTPARVGAFIILTSIISFIIAAGIGGIVANL